MRDHCKALWGAVKVLEKRYMSAEIERFTPVSVPRRWYCCSPKYCLQIPVKWFKCPQFGNVSLCTESFESVLHGVGKLMDEWGHNGFYNVPGGRSRSGRDCLGDPHSWCKQCIMGWRENTLGDIKKRHSI